jgi:hypothetical protein
VYAVHTVEVEVHNNKFEYWSYNYLGYTMSHTSTCPLPIYTKTNVDITRREGVELNTLLVLFGSYDIDPSSPTP